MSASRSFGRTRIELLIRTCDGRGGVVTNDGRLRVSLAEQGAGLTYVFEPMVAEQLRMGRLQVVLEAYAATVPGFFLYFPGRAQRSGPLRLFTQAAKELGVLGTK